MQAVIDTSTDGPEWFELPAAVTIVVHGVRIGFGAETQRELDEFKSIVPPGARRASPGDVDVAYTLCKATVRAATWEAEELVATVDRQGLAHSANRDAVLTTLHHAVELHVAEHAPRRTFVHAGVVAWNGTGVIIPGRTYSGKSTLVAALMHAGATYYSDEFAVVDQDGRVHPYPNPIQLRDASGYPDPEAAKKVPRITGKEPLTVGLVLITSYRPGGRSRFKQVSAGAGMLALLANTVSARRDPKHALDRLSRLVASAAVLKGPRGEARSAVRQLMRSAHLTK